MIAPISHPTPRLLTAFAAALAAALSTAYATSSDRGATLPATRSVSYVETGHGVHANS